MGIYISNYIKYIFSGRDHDMTISGWSELFPRHDFMSSGANELNNMGRHRVDQFLQPSSCTVDWSYHLSGKQT